MGTGSSIWLFLLRFLIALAILSVLFAFGMLAEHETRKLSGWMLALIFGLVGFLHFWISPRLASITMQVSWCLVLIDLFIRVAIRLYFGLRPNAYEIIETIFNTTPSESLAFLIGYWHTAVPLFLACGMTMWCVLRIEKKLFNLYLTKTDVFLRKTLKTTSLVFFMLFIALHFNVAMSKENTLLFWVKTFEHHQLLKRHMASFDQLVTLAPDSLSGVRYAGKGNHTVVMVIGESVNRHNLSLYGYQRETSPRMSAMKDDLYVFNDVISPSFLTVPSLQMMLSQATVSQPDNWRNQPSTIHLARAAGYKTFWLSNQESADGWISAIGKSADVPVFTNRGSIVMEGTYDDVLIPHFQQALADTAPLKFIVVHLQGSHFNYDMRYPASFSKFDGVRDGVYDEMVAAGRSATVIAQRAKYDNSLLFTDSVVAELFSALRSSGSGQSAAMMYIGDHGQEVGHNRDMSRHSVMDKSGWEVPLVIWFSDPPAMSKQTLVNRPYQADRMDATLLGLLKVVAPTYNPSDDLLNPHFTPARRFMGEVEYFLTTP